MGNGDTPWAANEPVGKSAAAADYRAAQATRSAVVPGDPGDPGLRPTRDEGSFSLTGEMARKLARDQPPDNPGPVPAAPAVTAEWALWGKETSETAYHVLRCSDGVFSRDDFREVITRYASGVRDRLPQYTVCWIPSAQGHHAYLGVAIHELADPDPARSGGRSRIVGGREVEYVRLFCVLYSEMAKFAVSYPNLVELVTGYQLPVGNASPIRIELRAASGRHRTIAAQFRVLAENVAALLLTTRPVCVLGAEGTTAEDRLRFIELVMSLLPYGLRSRLSASTWASSTAQDLKLRLFFANAPRDDGKTSHVTWGQPEPPHLSGEYEAVRLYLEWLRRTGSGAAPALAGMTEPPMRFTRENVYWLVDHLPTDRSVTETLEELAQNLRTADQAAIWTGVERLTRHLTSQDGRFKAIDREACRQVIVRRGMLKRHPALSQDTKEGLYSALLQLAFDTPFTYASYCEVERVVGGPPRGTLRKVLLQLKFSSFMPLLLAARAEPTFRDDDLAAALAQVHVPPTEPIDEVAQLTGKIRPEHRAVAYDFAANYLRSARDAWSELKERGYLAETLNDLFPRDLEAQRTRLMETLRFMYGGPLSQSQIDDLFSDSRLHLTGAFEQAVLSMAASRGAGREIARQAAFARLSNAGFEDEALLLTEGTTERYRPPFRERVRQLPRRTVTTAALFFVIAAFVVYLLVTAAYH
jgi:hypothetical protein